ncbi:hypothetical protein BHM03_00060769 [Ensete ventricosum]|uniref:Uncharacterized protein n=1 Tax=Ensete ventricosum TaxID=4639 RepID=A0A445MMS2_ENSVE|nr:hypothetical protein BHM03_00060769 [Ensete ventricosum]
MMHPLRFPNNSIRAKPVGAAPAGRSAARKGYCLPPEGVAPAYGQSLRGATPVEVPPAGAEPAARATAPWQGGCRWARQPPPVQGRRRGGGKGVRAFLLKKGLFFSSNCSRL